LVPVFGAVRLLADSIASLTPVVYTIGNNGIPVKRPTPSLFVNPSMHGTLFDWIHRLVTSMGLQGDGIGYVTARDYYGFPTMAEWLNPADVATDDGTNLAGRGSYMNPLWWWHGRPLVWSSNATVSEIIHIPWFCMPYRVRGFSPIGAFRLTANTGLGAAEYAAQWFAQGGVPPGTFQNTMQKVSKDDADIIEARLTNRLQRRRPLVYGSDWVYNPIAINPHEAQFVETARLTATEIATIYGIPPEKIGGTQGGSLTYTNVEQASLDYLKFSLRPWLVRIEMALSKLFPRGTFVKFDTTDLLRTDAKTRAEIDQIMLANQAYRTLDEVRADHDWPPMPKPDPVLAPASPLMPSAPSTNGNSPSPLAVGEN
jgi:HK97 family phage portal protein